jgi:hypothetical protein
VPCEVAVTVAPEIAEPDLSATVPEKLPVACPYKTGETQKASVQTRNRKSMRNLISNTPFENDDCDCAASAQNLLSRLGPKKVPPAIGCKYGLGPERLDEGEIRCRVEHYTAETISP